MTTIDSFATQPQALAPKQSQKAVIGSYFETFLRMLTTQLKNQDPLNPIESSDFAVQLATFSSVEQQVMTNDLLTSLSGQMGQMGMAQLANWVGMEARAPLPAQFDGFPVTLLPEPMAVADEARLIVRNTNGDVVQTQTIPVGEEPYLWLGRDASGQSLPSGLYSFEIESYLQGERQASVVPQTYARILEARIEAGKTILVMESGASVDADQVTALRNG
jgi:flagellar basal-body rod modification protein FlgD